MVEVQELETRIVTVPERAKALVITSDAQFVDAGELLKTIKGLRGQIDETFSPIISKANDAHKEALAQKRKVDAPLVEAEGILKPKIAAYIQEQERIRRQEELRLQKLAQEEAERLALESACMLEDIGESAQAELLLREPIVAEPVILPRSTPKVSGVSMSIRYSAQVTNLRELVMAVAAGKAPIQCLQADTTFLGRQAVALKESMRYPGVSLVKNGTIAAAKR